MPQRLRGKKARLAAIVCMLNDVKFERTGDKEHDAMRAIDQLERESGKPLFPPAHDGLRKPIGVSGGGLNEVWVSERMDAVYDLSVNWRNGAPDTYSTRMTRDWVRLATSVKYSNGKIVGVLAEQPSGEYGPQKPMFEVSYDKHNYGRKWSRPKDDVGPLRIPKWAVDWKKLAELLATKKPSARQVVKAHGDRHVALPASVGHSDRPLWVILAARKAMAINRLQEDTLRDTLKAQRDAIRRDNPPVASGVPDVVVVPRYAKRAKWFQVTPIPVAL